MKHEVLLPFFSHLKPSPRLHGTVWEGCSGLQGGGRGSSEGVIFCSQLLLNKPASGMAVCYWMYPVITQHRWVEVVEPHAKKFEVLEDCSPAPNRKAKQFVGCLLEVFGEVCGHLQGSTETSWGTRGKLDSLAFLWLSQEGESSVWFL